jgi:Ca2+-binding RTX toxin-like protein
MKLGKGTEKQSHLLNIKEVAPAGLISSDGHLGTAVSALLSKDKINTKSNGVPHKLAAEHLESQNQPPLENDVVTGSDEQDAIYTGDGNDHVYGQEGDDVIYGEANQDFLYGEGGNDTLYGGENADFLYGGAGDDTLYGGTHNDRIYGEDGADTLYGEEGADFLYGGEGNDILNGNTGSDTLDGGAGDDVLYGFSGLDILTGGEGADVFVFEAWAINQTDIITDFNADEGDVIDISDLLSAYDALTDAITDFVDITDNGTDSTLYVDVDGGADSFVAVASILNNAGLDESALVNSGNLIV